MGRREGIHGASGSGRKTVILREILEAAEGRGASWRSVNVAGVGMGYVSLQEELLCAKAAWCVQLPSPGHRQQGAKRETLVWQECGVHT